MELWSDRLAFLGFLLLLSAFVSDISQILDLDPFVSIFRFILKDMQHITGFLAFGASAVSVTWVYLSQSAT